MYTGIIKYIGYDDIGHMYLILKDIMLTRKLYVRVYT